MIGGGGGSLLPWAVASLLNMGVSSGSLRGSCSTSSSSIGVSSFGGGNDEGGGGGGEEEGREGGEFSNDCFREGTNEGAMSSSMGECVFLNTGDELLLTESEPSDSKSSE